MLCPSFASLRRMGRPMANTARRLVAGLLTGVGRGLEMGATQRLQDERERRVEERRVALAELEHTRAQQRQDRAHEQGLDRIDATAAANVAQRAGELRVGEPFQIRETERTERREAARDQRQYQQRRDLTILEGSIRERISRLDNEAAAARNSGDHAHAERMARLSAELGSGQITDVVQDQSGEYYGITRGGNIRRSNIRGNLPRSSQTDPLDALLSETGGAAPAGNQPPPRQAPAVTYSEADVRATMQATGLSREEVVRQIEARGFRRAQ